VSRVAEALGALDVPKSVAELEECLASYRPELRATPAARATARFLLLRPPLPVPARVPYGALAAAGVSLMPRWARRELRLPRLPVTEATVVRLGGEVVTRTIRWAMRPVE
jgi:uncharacterized protein (DUF2236 family)